MAAVQEPLRNGDVANFKLGQMEHENINIIKEEVNNCLISSDNKTD